MNIKSTSKRVPLLKDPLLHFLLLGLFVFALDYALADRDADPDVISISTRVDQELVDVFKSSRQREPSMEELEVLRQRWIDNEVLYRHGLALGLDQGDTAIRERVIYKAFNVMQAGIERLEDADEATLRAWFEQNRQRYDEPVRVDFLEAIVTGPGDEARVQQFADALNANTDIDIQSSLRIFRGRPFASIVASFGEDFADELSSMPLQTWQVARSREGLRVVMIESRRDMVPAQFEAVRVAVLQDWRDRRMQELRTEAVRELAQQYRIVKPDAVPASVATAAKAEDAL